MGRSVAELPDPFEFDLRDIALEHRQRKSRQPKPAWLIQRRHGLMADCAFRRDGDFPLYPAVFVDFGIQSVFPERRELS